MSKILLKVFVWLLTIGSAMYIGMRLGHDVSKAIIILIGSLNFIFWYQERGL